MKKIILSLGLAAALFGFDKEIPQKDLMATLKASPVYLQIAPLIKKGEVKLRGTLKNGFYVIEIDTKRGKGLLYLTKDLKYTIIGQVIDNKTMKPLIPNFPKNLQTINKGVMFTFGKGKKEIYLVTDPECPFCKKLEKEKGEFIKNNYKVHVILFPLPFHKNAKAMSYYILAGKNDQERAKRMQEILKGSDTWKKFKPTKAQKAKFDQELQNAQAAARELGARGTPSVFDKNLEPINWTKLGVKNAK
ncbi:MAG: thioredoxin fold domain-containing protein [Epsilonproteobacteria bacterium]|nr:thioredoxin fold domain-containing protein [Campylobacterota bacterium]